MPPPASTGDSELEASEEVSRERLDALFSATYEELRRLAFSVRQSDPGASLTPTTLVNEAWIKLSRSKPFKATSQLHFKRIAARAMRQVLVEAARRRNASKRGSGIVPIELEKVNESQLQQPTSAEELMSLDIALHELSSVSPRQAALVEARFFGGMDVKEVSELLGISEATALRDWRAAKAWLASELSRLD